MADEASLSICKFSDLQKQELQKLEEKMKKKWNIQLRWDSKVPVNDKWFLYFFTLRGLNVEEISNTITELVNEFDAINEDMKQIREGIDLSQERIESIRKRFEKVLAKMEVLNKSTDSSSLYAATNDALAKKEDVLRCFDHVEIVQSRRELPVRERQLDNFKKQIENKDKTIVTMSKLYDNYLLQDQKNTDTIDILENQSIFSRQNTSEYADLTNELKRKINPMLLDHSIETEESNDIHSAIETNMLVLNAVFDLFNSFEDSKDKEWKCEEKLVNFESKLAVYSLKTLQKILKLRQLVEKTISESNDKDKRDSKEKKQEKSQSDGVSSDELDFSDVLRKKNKERSEILKYHLEAVLDRNGEFREESEELMKLMNRMLPDAGCHKESVIHTVILINEYMKHKLSTAHKLIEDFNKRELIRNDKIENLTKLLREKIEKILEEMNKIIESLNIFLDRDDQNE